MRYLLTFATLVAVPLALGACDDGSVDSDEPDVHFDLELNGSGFNPHVGNTVMAAVVDADGVVVGTQSGTIPEDGTLSLLFEGVLEMGETYRVDWYADFNGNGVCDPAPDDHQWSEAVSAVQADVVVSYDHDTNFADVCDTF